MKLRPFKLERYFAKYEFNVDYVLCASDCESLTIQEVLAYEPESAEQFQSHWLGYTESPGSPALRREIARIYASIQPEQILVFSGAEEAIYLFMHAALSPGDHVIVHWPCYQSLTEVAHGLGCQVSHWEARPENGWALDLDELRRLISNNTKAIVVNNPHNPTGYLMPPEDFAQVCQIARDHGLLLFSDEVYREAEYEPADRLPAGCDLYENAVSLGVMSKSYGLPGLRIGWIATHASDLYRRIAALKDYTTICSSAPSEFLAEVALRHREALAQRNVDLIQENLEVLEAFFARHPERFTWLPPHAGPIAFPRLLGENVDDFCDRLVKDHGVLLMPGTAFDHPGNHFRIGFGRRNMPAALDRLETHLDRS